MMAKKRNAKGGLTVKRVVRDLTAKASSPVTGKAPSSPTSTDQLQQVLSQILKNLQQQK